MAFELPPAVYSAQLLESVIYDLEQYLEWHRQSSVKQKVGAKPAAEPSHSAETAQVIKIYLQGQVATVAALEALLGELKAVSLPEVHITLAALPNHAQREALVAWFRANITPHILITFVADRNLGGGVVVRTPNHVFDFTWKQQLLAGRSHIAEIVKRV
ncbi:MAG TPA: hypothetical protein VI322_04470 [Candidatus Saccharimonadia bacterium]